MSSDSLGTPLRAPRQGDDDRTAQLQRALGDLYEVRGLIGRGGFAEVYQAYEPRLKRMVAIKVLGADLSAVPEMLDRFRREAEAVARLRHPHIVPIYSVGDATGIAWYVMPLVEGESLRSWLERERPLATADAWRVLREVTAALTVAHRAGFVHRDIKPENIMLDGPERRALVMDFGIAKAIGVAQPGANLTGTGMAVGTPRYMSPEQAAGEAVDARADVYSVAVVGYEMLAGRLPFEGNSFRDVIVKQATEAPPSLAELAPSAPEALVAALERSLDRDPARRFADAGELAKALEPRTAAGPALSSPSMNVAERIPKWMRRTMAAVGVVCLALTFGIHERAFPWTRVEGINSAQASQVVSEFLYANGMRGSYRERVALWVNDSVVGYLEAAVGPAAASAWAAKHFPVYEWRIRRDYDDSTGWAMAVDIEGKIRSSRHWHPDTVYRLVNADTALRAATAWLAQLGFTAAELVRTDTSVGRSVDHDFRWRLRRDSVRWSGAPTPAYQEVSVRTAGTHIATFQHRLATPDAFAKAVDETMTRAMWVGLLMFLPALMLIASGIKLRRVKGEDSGREMLARKLCYTGAAIYALAYVSGYGAELATRQRSSWILMPAMLALMMLIAVLAAWMVSTIDQHVRQQYPGVIAGYLEAGAGRLTGRPMATGWLMAYGVGGLVVLGGTLGNLALADRVSGPHMTFDLPDVFNQVVPLAGLTELVTAFAMPAVLVIIFLAITRLTRPEVAPVLAVVLFTIGDLVTAGPQKGTVLLLSLATYSAGALFVLRFGLLVTAWGLYIAGVFGVGLTLLAASSAGFRFAGIVTLAFVALPAVLGVMAQRRMQGSGGATTSGAAAA